MGFHSSFFFWMHSLETICSLPKFPWIRMRISNYYFSFSYSFLLIICAWMVCLDMAKNNIMHWPCERDTEESFLKIDTNYVISSSVVSQKNYLMILWFEYHVYDARIFMSKKKFINDIKVSHWSEIHHTQDTCLNFYMNVFFPFFKARVSNREKKNRCALQKKIILPWQCLNTKNESK